MAMVQRGVSPGRNYYGGSHVCGTEHVKRSGDYSLITARVIIFNTPPNHHLK
jgi:hypothetical protein